MKTPNEVIIIYMIIYMKEISKIMNRINIMTGRDSNKIWLYNNNIHITY